VRLTGGGWDSPEIRMLSGVSGRCHRATFSEGIRDARVFDEAYVPPTVIGREDERRQLGLCLSPMKEGQAPLNAWLYGPAGSGKTVVARAVAREVCTAHSGRHASYVNCWERHSLYQVVQAIADDLRVLGAEAQDTNVKLERIRRALRDEPTVVILDDIDRLRPTHRERIIYGLSAMPRTGLICISHGNETLLALEERTKSRLSPTVIPFAPYTAEDIKAILADRAHLGLKSPAPSDALLTRLAHTAHGDARVAVQGLRVQAWSP